MSKKQLGAAQGIEAACILFQLNSKTADILRLAQNAGLPPVFTTGAERARLCAEWRAFVHAAVTAGLMQHAPNSVLVGYLRQTGPLLRAAEADTPGGCAPPESQQPAQTDFVDGPFASYMTLLGHGEQAGCPSLFCRRLADDDFEGSSEPAAFEVRAGEGVGFTEAPRGALFHRPVSYTHLTLPTKLEV